jgi:hypothetical protein
MSFIPLLEKIKTQYINDPNCEKVAFSDLKTKIELILNPTFLGQQSYSQAHRSDYFIKLASFSKALSGYYAWLLKNNKFNDLDHIEKETLSSSIYDLENIINKNFQTLPIEVVQDIQKYLNLLSGYKIRQINELTEESHGYLIHIIHGIKNQTHN